MSLVEYRSGRTGPGSPSIAARTVGGPGRVLAAFVLVVLAAGGLAACGDDDDGAAVVPTSSRLPDPCRLISASQLRQEFEVDFSVRPPAETPPSEEEVTELSCSWTTLEVEPSVEYLEEDVPTFVDVVVRRSGPDGSVDGAALMDEAMGDPGAAEVPALVAAGEDTALADAAVAIGGTLFVMKGDVLLTVSTDSADSLDQLAGEVLERIIRRI